MAKTPQIPVLVVALANERTEAGFLRGLSLELKAILEAMRPIEQKGQIETLILPAATAREIADIFQDERYKGRIRLFHYAGHADEDELWLENEAGSNQGFSSLGLAKFLSLRKEIQLVFLNACATQKHADFLLEAGVPAAIVTDRKISDTQAQSFAERFYIGLANGARIDEAYREAEAYVIGSVKDVQRELSRSLIWRAKDSTEVKQFPWRLFPAELDTSKLFQSGRFFSSLDDTPPPILDAMVKTYIGETFNNYRIVKLLGAGTSSMVFMAVHQTFHSEAAVKITFSIREGFQKAKSTITTGSNALRQLEHPNMVEIYDVGTEGEQIIFIIMELVKGERLDNIRLDPVARDKRGIDQLIQYAIQICEGLKAAHEFAFDTGEGVMQQGFVHGNLMPRKVMFSESGILKLIDFAFADLNRAPGIRFDVPEEDEHSEYKINRDQNNDFLPPEVRRGIAPVSKITDIYGIGAIFYWMITGKAPLDREKYSLEHVIQTFKGTNPLLDEKISQIIYKATHPNPVERYFHLSEMVRDLKACVSKDEESRMAFDLALAEDSDDFEGIKEKLLGQELNGYKIEEYLGANENNMAFRARNVLDGQLAALKISHRILSGFEEAKKVIEAKGEVMTYLAHPNITSLIYIGQLGNEEYVYIIREFSDGMRLDGINFRVTERRYFGIRNLIQLFVSICEGVRAIHNAEFLDKDGKVNYGVMHGNLSMKKIYINKREKVKVTDMLFGQFPHLNELVFAIPDEIRNKNRDENLLDFMPPEVVDKKTLPSKRTDVYSLGAIFFEILSGRKLSDYIPETEYHLFRLLRQRNTKIPRRVSETLFRSIHPDPYRRFNTVDELIHELKKNTIIYSRLFYRIGHHELS